MRNAHSNSTVAYVLKGYPRASEAFITSEILRLERAGLPLRLFVIKRAEERTTDLLARSVRTIPVYLPATAPVSNVTLARWLRQHLARFVPALTRVALRCPIGLLRAMVAAAAQAIRAREAFWAWPRKVYTKEFLLATALADEVLRAGSVRHLHAHFAHGATTVTWLAAFMLRLPYSFTAHAKDIYARELNPAGLLERKLRSSRFAITCTEANREYLQRLAPDVPVYRFYHGLNAAFTELMAGDDDTRCPHDELRLLGVGRLVAKKGFDVFVDACARLASMGVPLRARIIGEDGDATAMVRHRIAALGLDRHVDLVGPMDQAALLREYRRATVFCLPCRVMENGDRDGIPNVLIEAMACGVPVVTTPVSGIPELVAHGDNGVLIPPNDAIATAAAILDLYERPGFRDHLSRRGQATVRERFDGDRLVAEHVTLFTRVIAS